MSNGLITLFSLFGLTGVGMLGFLGNIISNNILITGAIVLGVTLQIGFYLDNKDEVSEK